MVTPSLHAMTRTQTKQQTSQDGCHRGKDSPTFAAFAALTQAGDGRLSLDLVRVGGHC